MGSRAWWIHSKPSIHDSKIIPTAIYGLEEVLLLSRVTVHYVGDPWGLKSLIGQKMNITVGADGFSRALVRVVWTYCAWTKMSYASDVWKWPIRAIREHDLDDRIWSSSRYWLSLSQPSPWMLLSFKTYPDWDGGRSLGTVSSQMNIDISYESKMFLSCIPFFLFEIQLEVLLLGYS